MLDKVVEAGISRGKALRMMRGSGKFEEPSCAITARAFSGRCLAHGPSELREHYYEWRLYFLEACMGAVAEANKLISHAASEAFDARLRDEGAVFGIERPNDLYSDPCCFPTYAQMMGAFLDKGNYDIGVAVLNGAISHAVMAKALGLGVVYVRAKRHGAWVHFEPLCNLEMIRGKRTLIIEDDMCTGRTMKKVVSGLRRHSPASIEIGLFSNTNPLVGEDFMGCRIAYDQYKMLLGEKGECADYEMEYAAIVRLLHGLRQ